MRREAARLLSIVLSGGLILPSCTFSQTKSAPQSNPTKQLSKKERYEREQKAFTDLDPLWRAWLNEDVPYIIMKEERGLFLQLSSEVERVQFVEQFWQRRNPQPHSLENPFKEEHYRRIAFANDRFSASIPGRKTDRGRVYIMWGPPDNIESHPDGGPSNRPPEEGRADTFPWEKWHYDYLEGVGADVNLEFVDPDASGDYRLTMDHTEKDALLNVPCRNLSNREPPFCSATSANQPAKIVLLVGPQQSPQVKFKDLEALVVSHIVRGQVHFDYRYEVLRATSFTNLVPVTVEIPGGAFSFQNEEGKQTAHLNLFERITTFTGRVVSTIEQTVSQEFLDSTPEPPLDEPVIYQRPALLGPGIYRLDIAAQDQVSGKVGTISSMLHVPAFADDKLDASTLILGTQIPGGAVEQWVPFQLEVGPFAVRPRVNREFTSAEEMGVFLQVYNLSVDRESQKADVSVVYRITNDLEETKMLLGNSDQLHSTGEQTTLNHIFPLSSLQPGHYKIEIQVTDQLTHQTISRTAEFTVKPASADSSGSISYAPS